tara:strand:+ start:436 stop:693 length:258 start_codon:yes stop_codon:yes gene_type:complete
MAYSGGLRKWFKEEWVDIKTGKPCGRKSASDSSRPYPACRPKRVAQQMTKKEKEKASAAKKGPKRVKYSVTAGGKRRVGKKKKEY